MGGWRATLRSPDPAHRPELTPGRALPALRVVQDVARAQAVHEAGRSFARRFDVLPELVFLQVVLRLETGQVVLRLLAQQPAGRSLSRKRAIEPSQRLDPDEVAHDEHVERDLQLQLRVDLGRRERRLTRLVVLDDPTCRKWVDVDPVDLPGQREAAEVEARLELGCRALGSEQHLEAARSERQVELRLLAHEVLEVTPQALLELAPVEIGQLEPEATLERVVEALVQEFDGLLEAGGL